MKAVIIEDRPEMAAMYRGFVSQFVEEVVVADTLTEGLEVLTSEPAPHLITLDLNFPESREKDTLAKIPDIRRMHPNAILIVLTGVATMADEQKIMELGADALFEKVEVGTQKTFVGRLKDVLSSLISQPRAYTRNIGVVEELSVKVADRMKKLAS